MSAPQSRPAGVTAAFWLLVVGGVILAASGFLTATVSFSTLREVQPPQVSDQSIHSVLKLNRGLGILFGISGLSLVGLAVRARNRDVRARRGAMVLGLAIVVVVSVASVYGGHVLALLSLLPIIVGTLLLNRPNVVEWYAGDHVGPGNPGETGE